MIAMGHPALSNRWVVQDNDPREHLPRWTSRLREFSPEEQARIVALWSEVHARGCTPLSTSIEPNGSVSCGTVETIPNTYGHSRYNLRLDAQGKLFDSTKPIERMTNQ